MIFFVFSSFFGQKSIFWVLGRKICIMFSPILYELYCSQFVLLYTFLRLLSSAGSLNLSNFFTKNRGFSKLFGRKKIQKTFFTQMLELILWFLSYHTHLYLDPSRRAHQMSKSLPPQPLAPYRFLESGRPDQVSAGAHFSMV